MFARQAIQMSWDFVENNPFAGAAGDLSVSVASVARVVDGLPASTPATVAQLDATAPRAEGASSRAVVCTDPPYYDNVTYADLSDFFYVWLRQMASETEPQVCSTLEAPKVQELVAAAHRHASRHAAQRFFESGIRHAFEAMVATHESSYPMTVFYAFKQTETHGDIGAASTGWDTMLTGLLDAGLTINGTWPVRSERPGRTREIASNALATSIVLTCRRRLEPAPLATRKDFLAALKSELPGALRHLQQGSIAPVDLAQAAIGPGMAVFSRSSRVVEADGSAMSVRTALGLINQVLDETLAEQEADFDGDTRWAVAWFEQHGMNPGPFGVAETLSKAKNTAINGLVAAGILESKAGKVRLLDRTELPATWDPASDARLTVWELAQHLIRALESGGENDAAALLRRIGGLGEAARELAYRLYVICERKKWAKEALAYNALVVAWPEISRLAAAAPAPSAPDQQELL
jgi:putative DNA methylase